MSTIGVDFKIKTFKIGKHLVKLQIYDTGGQERFRTITANYYHAADGIIVVYDIADRVSFDAVPQWLDDIDALARPEACKILIGNKSDLEHDRTTQKDEAMNLAQSFGMPFFETSAKENLNVNEMFMKMAEAIKETRDKTVTSETEVKPVNLQGKPIGESSCWCSLA